MIGVRIMLDVNGEGGDVWVTWVPVDLRGNRDLAELIADAAETAGKMFGRSTLRDTDALEERFGDVLATERKAEAERITAQMTRSLIRP